MTTIDRLYHNPFAARLFHTTIHCLRSELAGCDSILDLGCGPGSPLRFVEAARKVGVEAFGPYVEMSNALGIHDEYIHADLRDFDFRDNSFDAVVMIEVLEHLEKSDGERVLDTVERVARKKIVITCPNGFLEQGSHDENPFQVHRSGWSIGDMRARGYTVRGMAGLRMLRREKDHDESMLEQSDDDRYASIRFPPRRLWFTVAAASQVLTYFFPRFAFELICTKRVV